MNGTAESIPPASGTQTVGRVRCDAARNTERVWDAVIAYMRYQDRVCFATHARLAADTSLPESHGWEHVSVSREDRCPTWDEMCQVKNLFWDDEDVAMQFHVPSKDHVNNHPYCLHLWRPIGITIPLPPACTVGVPIEAGAR